MLHEGSALASAVFNCPPFGAGVGVQPLMSTTATATPAMRQYLDAKRQYRDAIVFFRMGDFYEMFYEDALVGVAGARPDADVALEGRRRQRHPDVRRALPRGGRLHRAAGAGRAIASRSASRSRIRRRPRGSSSAKSCASSRRARSTDAQLSRRARAGVPDGDRAGPRTGSGSSTTAARAGATSTACRRRAGRPVDRRVHAAEYRGAGRPAGAGRRDRRAASARDRRAGRVRRSSTRLPEIAPARSCRSPRIDGWTLRARGGAPDAARSAQDARPRRLRPRRARRPRCWPPAALVALPARHAEGGPRARARGRLRASRRRPAHRSDHAEASRDRERQRGRPQGSLLARDRSHGHVDGRPAAARLAAAPARSRSSRFAIASTPSRSSRSATTDRGKVRETLKSVHDLERLVARACARHRRPARSGRAAATRCAAVPRLRADARRTARRRSCAACAPSSTTWPTCASWIERDARSTSRRRSRATAASSATASTRELDELRAHQPVGPAGHRRDGRARARAHRHHLAQGPLQPRLRLLHRDLEVEPARGAGRLPAASRRSPAASASRRRR